MKRFSIVCHFLHRFVANVMYLALVNWLLLADAFDMAESVGKLGAPLSEADASAVVLKPMRPYSEGELCAAKDPRAASHSAAAAAQGRAEFSETSSKPAIPITAEEIDLQILLLVVLDVHLFK